MGLEPPAEALERRPQKAGDGDIQGLDGISEPWLVTGEAVAIHHASYSQIHFFVHLGDHWSGLMMFGVFSWAVSLKPFGGKRWGDSRP